MSNLSGLLRSEFEMDKNVRMQFKLKEILQITYTYANKFLFLPNLKKIDLLTSIETLNTFI